MLQLQLACWLQEGYIYLRIVGSGTLIKLYVCYMYFINLVNMRPQKVSQMTPMWAWQGKIQLKKTTITFLRAHIHCLIAVIIFSPFVMVSLSKGVSVETLKPHESATAYHSS